jgi:low affinity Fe/Cu permease
MSKWFSHFASRASHWAGHYIAFIAAVGIVLIWAATGPLFAFSSTWQLVINTGTTIITFLMVFLIQNSQNRDSMAIHLKLDELLRAVNEANNELIEAEDEDEKSLEQLKKDYMKLVEEHKHLQARLAERSGLAS